MENTVKITKAMVLEVIAEQADAFDYSETDVTADDVREFAEKTIAQLEAKAAKAKEKAAEKRAASDELQKTVESVLTDELQSAEDIAAQINDEDVTKGKVVNRLSKLVASGVAVKEPVKVEGSKSKKMCYRLA